MKLPHFLLALTLVVTLTACTAPTKVTSNSASTAQPAPGATPPADLNEPDLSQKYQAYSAKTMDMVRGEQKFVVFFNADWCGTCVAWDKKTKANLANLPEGTLILKADYDAETALVKDLRVKTQSSAVFFNASGEIIDTIIDPSQTALMEFFSTPDVNVIAESEGKYVTFDQAKYEAAKGNEKFVIFFYADWCGTCRTWEKKLREALVTLPANTKVFKADFDSELALRKAYGVTMQSVAAFIAADGTLAKTEADPSMESVAEFFNN